MGEEVLDKCCACGANVQVLGDTTHYYKNLDTKRIEFLKKELDQQRFNNKHNLSIDTKVSERIKELETALGDLIYHFHDYGMASESMACLMAVNSADQALKKEQE